MLDFKDKIISYRQYYKISIVYSVVSSVIWLIHGIVDLFVMKENDDLLANIIVYSLLFVSIAATLFIYMLASCMRDKEDELYKENVAKANSSFLWFLFFAGFALFITVSIAKVVSDTVTIPLHESFIGAVMYVLYAVYNGIALHYENCADAAEEE